MISTKTPNQWQCEKTPVRAGGGIVVSNHVLASAAGAEMLAAGGNAVDAAVASLFALTVVEPMMVSIFGGGLAHIHMADGRHVILDGLSRAPAAATSTMYQPIAPDARFSMEVRGHANEIGVKAVATPGSLRAWCDALRDYGTLALGDVIAPAVRYASGGFKVTPYLSGCIKEVLLDIKQDPALSSLLLPEQRALAPGECLKMPDYADTLTNIGKYGDDKFYNGPIGEMICKYFEKQGGLITKQDLISTKTKIRKPVTGVYRNHVIYGPPPPSAGGIHIVQMLNILEGYDLKRLGPNNGETLHLIGEALGIAFADRAAVTADPDYVDIPVDKILSKSYAELRRREIKPAKRERWYPEVIGKESANTTHVTVVDRDGNVIATTQTLNNLFGACIRVPEIGVIANDYMCLFDPRPGHALSIAPGKRVTTSMAPTIVQRDGRVRWALGTPGGLRIFGSVMQVLSNLIDHEMQLQEAVEAPRVWTQGAELEIEPGFPSSAHEVLTRKGWVLKEVPHIGGGMAAIEQLDDGTAIGASCWRADGAPIGISGGNARPGTRFWSK